MTSSEREGETGTERTVTYPRSPNKSVAKDVPTHTKVPRSTKIFSCNAKKSSFLYLAAELLLKYISSPGSSDKIMLLDRVPVEAKKI